MATRVKARASELYETDWYAWAKGQAELLREGRFDELDLEHLTEEVDDLGESLHRSVRSRIRTIIEHLLKLEHSPAQDPRAGWGDTIDTQRSELLDELTPTLHRHLEQDLAALYAQARKRADRSLRRYGEHVAADDLPTDCPYSFEQITGDWLP